MHAPVPPVIRLTRPTDINIVVDLDLKCYDYPWAFVEWQQAINDNGKNGKARIVLLEVDKKPAGFAMWQIGLDNIVRVQRFGILPKYRNKGLGFALMSYMRVFCEGHISRPEKMQVVVPHIYCVPGDPENVAPFLTKCGFHATGEILPEVGVMYGNPVEGYVFESELNSVLAC